MTNFLITNEGDGINLSLLEHFEIQGKDVFLTVAGETYVTSLDKKITIEEFGRILARALSFPIPVVHWNHISREIG